MATTITNECINCGACEPECPNIAIYQGGVEWEFRGAKHPAISNEIFYIVPDKCTECVGFYDHEACAAVCPVDCCVPDPARPETHEVLLARAAELHPDKTFGADAPSRFHKDAGSPGGGDAPAAAPAAPAPAPSVAATAPAAAVSAAKPAAVRPIGGRAEKKLAGSAPRVLAKPVGVLPGELEIPFEEALSIVRPRRSNSGVIPAPLGVLVAVLQPLLGALPVSTKNQMEAAVRNPSIFSSAGATYLNVLLHLIAVPILAVLFASTVLGESVYSDAVRPWFFWGAVAAGLEAMVRLREGLLRPQAEEGLIYRGSFYGIVVLPLAVLVLGRSRVRTSASGVGVEGYYGGAGAFDEKTERERRYGRVYSVEDLPDGYYVRLEMPRRVPPSGVREELGLGDEMPDYDIDIRIGGAALEIRGSVPDPQLRAVAAAAPAFPPDFATRIPLEDGVAGFARRYEDKVLELVLVKSRAAKRLPELARAA